MFEDFFIERITSLRNQKNVSAREMSLAIGQNPSYINRIENGKTFPSMQTFFYIFEYFNISTMEFFNDGCPYPLKTNQIIEALSKLDDTQLDAILALIKTMQNH